MLKLINHVLAVLLFCCLLADSSVQAQNIKPSSLSVFGEPDGLDGNDCESIKAYLDFVHIAVMEIDKNQTIIIIARLGGGENSRKLNHHRLSTVSSYLVNSRAFPKDQVIIAEGERVRGLAQVEFYIGGKLHTVFKVKRNRDLVKGCDE